MDLTAKFPTVLELFFPWKVDSPEIGVSHKRSSKIMHVSTSAGFVSAGAVLFIMGELFNSLGGLLIDILPPKFLSRPMMPPGILGVCGGPMRSSSPACEPRCALVT